MPETIQQKVTSSRRTLPVAGSVVPLLTGSPANNQLAEGWNRLEHNLPFTGERVIPGEVETQLWNEHVARYRFASLFCKGKRVLDVGCGTGYGTELLGHVAKYALGFDISQEAVKEASSAYGHCDFACSSAQTFPIAEQSFDVITAFEVIEHLENWREFLCECTRVLSPDGIFVVSTPNTDYYVEARGPSGPNPFHIHEFQFSEFRSALNDLFPSVQILAQNQQETITFSGDWITQKSEGFIPATNDVADAHFFVAVCSFRPIQVPFFADVSSTHNLLREREKHIRGLQGELAAAERQHAELRGQLTSAQLQLERALEEQRQIRRSAWMRVGRLLGVGPWSTYRADFKNFWRRRKDGMVRFGKAGPDVCIRISAIFALAIAASTLAITDIFFWVSGRKRPRTERIPDHSAASVVIPTWNGLNLLRENLPSVMQAASKVPGTEILLVDDASSDETVAYVEANFSDVRVLRLETNQGFAAACNRGAEAATNDVVVFLNNDMRVHEQFLSTLLRNFCDPQLFAVSAQIFFADPAKRREETGLTELQLEQGRLRVGHRDDPLIKTAYPCAYAGGGSSAFDRRKFLDLGGFDSLFCPFYFEDTDLSYRAWKRGWKVLYEPNSHVYHEHRGTVGKRFPDKYVEHVVRRNAALYCWKNIQDWSLLRSHFGRLLRNTLTGRRSEHECTASETITVLKHLPQLTVSRWRAWQTREISDTESLRRPLGGYYRDRFLLGDGNPPDRLNVLLVSPYPIEPPTHGGAVFMRETLRGLVPLANVHVVSFVDREEQLKDQQALLSQIQSGSFLVRPHVALEDQWTLTPNAIREFAVCDFEWAIHRTILLENIDVVQLEYTTMGQYAGRYRHIPCMLFEHDISAQSLWRRVKAGDRNFEVIREYLRMRLYEPKILKRVSRVQVCSADNARYLQRLVSGLRGRVDPDVRATIDVQQYRFITEDREPDSLLFVGSFRHGPNLDALRWFIGQVFPKVLAARPETTLYVVGSDALPDWEDHPNVRLLGAVADVKAPLQQYSVFVCPVLSGSGIRVKLLEAFASGIPAVSTSVGAEGLSSKSGTVCEIADSAAAFADATLKLLSDNAYGCRLAESARHLVEERRNSRTAVVRLEALYRSEVTRLRGSLASPYSAKDARARPASGKGTRFALRGAGDCAASPKVSGSD